MTGKTHYGHTCAVAPAAISGDSERIEKSMIAFAISADNRSFTNGIVTASLQTPAAKDAASMFAAEKVSRYQEISLIYSMIVQNGKLASHFII